MKRLNWLKKFGLTATVASATVPAILMSTSCSNVTSGLVDVFDFAQTLKDQSAENVTRRAASFDNLLYGSMGNHSGNYILFVGSNQAQATRAWFGVIGFDYQTREDWYKTENFKQSLFFQAIDEVKNKEEYTKVGHLKTCGFYSFIDFWDQVVKDKKGHVIDIAKDNDTKIDTITPFTKWSTYIDPTYYYNKNKNQYEWDKDSVSKDDYIRQDDSAKAYRAMCKRANQLYPKTDKRKDIFELDDTPRMAVFKAGKLVSIQTFPSGIAGKDSFVKTIIDNYKDIEDEKK